MKILDKKKLTKKQLEVYETGLKMREYSNREKKLKKTFSKGELDRDKDQTRNCL